MNGAPKDVPIDVFPGFTNDTWGTRRESSLGSLLSHPCLVAWMGHPFSHLARRPLDRKQAYTLGRRAGLRGQALGTTRIVMDCAGNVALSVLVELPPEGAVTVLLGWATIALRLALL
jgi:hypothetical protein